MTTRSRWILKGADRGRARLFARTMGLSRVAATLLAARGVADEEQAHRVLRPSFDDLHDPMLMMGMDRAVRRVLEAVDRKEKITLFTDFDTDGTTSCVILRRAFRLLGVETDYHIPDRFTEGYGLNQETMERKLAEGYRLMISADCGITAHGPVGWARDNGLDVIVTDHHLPDGSARSPDAYAVLNPNQTGCPYPAKELAGVGVAWKLIHAVLKAKGMEHYARGFLKVVAVGTVVDMASLTGENRVLTSLGLADLPSARNAGLRALLEVSSLGESARITSADLSFRVGPRINAAGRMEAATMIVELFEAEGADRARELAARLDALNGERQRVQAEIAGRALLECEDAASAEVDMRVAVVAGEGWHRGVIGIAASKVVERIGLPAVIISLDGEVGHGSARSIAGYHLLNGLHTCSDFLTNYGGHTAAAGLVIHRDYIPVLRERLNAHAFREIPPEALIPKVEIDAELTPGEIGLDVCEDLRALEPFGQGWPQPLFASRGLRVAKTVTMKEKHLKLFLTADDGRRFEAVWWNAAERLEGRPAEGDRVDVAYRLEENTWKGETRLQLVVQDVRPCSK